METEVKLEVGYRAIVEKHITDDAGNIPRGSPRKLASKLKCDPSFLSHYLKEKCDFSADHAYRFAKAYDFSDQETKAFVELVMLEKVADIRTKSFLKKIWNVKEGL